MERLHARIYGVVQGVGFRHFVWKQALRLNLTGWVRNRRDGSVEVVAEGPRSALEDLLQELHRGPWGARVDRVEVSWEPASQEFLDFEVRPTV